MYRSQFKDRSLLIRPWPKLLSPMPSQIISFILWTINPSPTAQMRNHFKRWCRIQRPVTILTMTRLLSKMRETTSVFNSKTIRMTMLIRQCLMWVSLRLSRTRTTLIKVWWLRRRSERIGLWELRGRRVGSSETPKSWRETRLKEAEGMKLTWMISWTLLRWCMRFMETKRVKRIEWSESWMKERKSKWRRNKELRKALNLLLLPCPQRKD
jgi:hypothetical protein